MKKSASENHLIGFKCIRCGKDYSPEQIRYTCPVCEGNLDARYDYKEIRRKISPASLSSNKEPSLWRYRSFLPLNSRECPIPLKVGMTPFTRALNLGKRLGLENLYVKNDGLNPSGSLKDRASYVVVAHCLEKDKGPVCTASTGNAGISLACIAASAQMESIIFVPENIPREKLAQLMIYGAKILCLRGNYSQAFEFCKQATRHFNWYNRNTGTNPYTREGEKTVSYEIWEQMAFHGPDFVIASVGDGNIISGIYKGFFDLYETGWIDKIPRLVGVQSVGSASITNAFQGDGIIRCVKPHTVADSISVSKPSDGEAALKAVRETQGAMIAVDDRRILESIRLLAETEGIFGESSGVACLAGLRELLDDGLIPPRDNVVLIVTGNGLKDVKNALKVSGQAVTIEPDLEELLKVLSID